MIGTQQKTLKKFLSWAPLLLNASKIWLSSQIQMGWWSSFGSFCTIQHTWYNLSKLCINKNYRLSISLTFLILGLKLWVYIEIISRVLVFIFIFNYIYTLYTTKVFIKWIINFGFCVYCLLVYEYADIVVICSGYAFLVFSDWLLLQYIGVLCSYIYRGYLVFLIWFWLFLYPTKLDDKNYW